MGSQLEEHGDSTQQSFASNIKISHKRAKFQQLTATVTGLEVALPDATYIDEGYLIIQVIVDPASNDFEITDAAGGTLVATASANDVYAFALFDGSTVAGDWEAKAGVLGSTGAPPATVFPSTLGGTVAALINDAWRFDFVANTWGEGSGDSTASFSDPAGAVISGQGFVGNNLADHERYNPQTWDARTDHTDNKDNVPGSEVSLATDTALYFGSPSGAGVGNRPLTDEYDLSGDSFTSKTDMPEGRWRSRAERSGTDIFVMGGTIEYTAIQDAIGTIRGYDTVGDSWDSGLTDMTNIRLNFASARDADDNPIVYCGATRESAITRIDDVEEYSVTGDSWSALTDYPNGTSSRFGGCKIAANSRAYLAGGETGSNTDATYEHLPTGDTYNSRTDHGAGGTVSGTQHSTMGLTD